MGGEGPAGEAQAPNSESQKEPGRRRPQNPQAKSPGHSRQCSPGLGRTCTGPSTSESGPWSREARELPGRMKTGHIPKISRHSGFRLPTAMSEAGGQGSCCTLGQS